MFDEPDRIERDAVILGVHLFDGEAEKISELLFALDKLGGCRNNFPFIAELISTYFHRTCQQGIFSFFTYLCAQWEKDLENNNFDGRNSYTCNMSHKIMEILESSPGAPLI